jgi:hypothetical protein
MKKALLPSFQMADQPTLTLGNTTAAAVYGNADFTTPSPTQAVMQEAITNYTASLAAAKYGSRDDKAQKNADKQNLISLLRQLCDYVNSIAQGDVTILAGCGFPLSKSPQPVALGVPQAKVQNGTSGELILSTPAVEGAVAYKHQYSADPNAALWPEVVTSRATCKIASLQPGTVYSLRIVAIGTNDQVSSSDVVTKMVA